MRKFLRGSLLCKFKFVQIPRCW